MKAGSNQRTHPIGVMHIDDVRKVRIADITDDEAIRAGFADRASLVASLGEYPRGPLRNQSEVFRVELHFVGEVDRVEGADAESLSAIEIESIRARLQSMDARSKAGPWTLKTLQCIAKHPRQAASGLAKGLGRKTAPFKADVVKLKKLGLTESFEVGYDLTPRGRAYLSSTRSTKRRTK